MDNLLDDGFNEKQNKHVIFAGFWTRVMASLIDFVVYLAVIPFTLYNMSEWKSIPILAITTIIPVVYKPFMEFKYGATWGKMAKGIVVTNYDFGKPDLTEICSRNILNIGFGIFSFCTSLYVFSLPEFKEVTGFMEYAVLSAKNAAISTVNNVLSLVLLVDVLLMFSDKQLRTIHDKIGKTYVVTRDSLEK